MSAERTSPIRRRFDQFVRAIDRETQERIDKHNRMVQEVAIRAEVNNSMAQYAISARTFELSADPNKKAIFDQTMKVVGQKPGRERDDFMRALEIARELKPSADLKQQEKKD